MLKRLFTLALVGAFIYAVYRWRDQLVGGVEVLREGVWYLVIAGLVVYGVGVVNKASLYSSLYNIVGLPSGRKRMVPVMLTSNFMAIVAPFGGLSGWVPFIQDARRRGIPIGMVLIANLVYQVFWYTSVSVFLLAGLLSLFLAEDLQWFQVVAAGSLMLIDGVMISGLLMAMFAPGPLKGVLLFITRALDKVASFIRREGPFTDAQVKNFVKDINEAAKMMRKSGPQLAWPAIHAIGAEALNLLILFLMFRAFNIRAGLGVLLAGYGVSVLFSIISPTSGGIVFVESAMILVFTSLGVEGSGPTVVTLAYRAVTWWVPFVLGFATMRWANGGPEASMTKAET